MKSRTKQLDKLDFFDCQRYFPRWKTSLHCWKWGAHHVVGEVVQHASQNTMQLSEIKLHELQKISDSFEEDVVNVFDFDLAVARKKAVGGTAPEAVRQQIKIAMQHIALHE